MHRFFIEKERFQGHLIFLPDDVSHQIRHVLHLKDGDSIIILDNSGMQFEAKIIFGEGKIIRAEVISSSLVDTEPLIKLHFFFSLTQREKFEMILQKCTEIGVAVFHPFTSSRSLVRSISTESNKLARWKKILKEASEQSHRGIIPEIMPTEPLEKLITESQFTFDRSLFAWEESNSLFQTSKSPLIQSIALFIGPEGGFSLEEAEMARDKGMETISLGKRILRMETAAIVSCSLLLYNN